MSEVRVTTLKDTSGNNSSTTEQIGRGRVKAFVNFNGQGAVAIRNSFNTNSITDRAGGRYTMNFSTSFADANYSIAGAADDIVGLVTTDYDGAYGGTKNASGCTIGVCDSRSAGYTDYPMVNVIVCR